MALVRGEAVILKTHALGNTSRIVAAYTRDHGLVRLVAKGARSSPSRFGFALEPLSRSRLTFYLKPDRDLQFLSQAETIDAFGARLTDFTRLAYAEAALELMDRVVWGEEPHPELYDLLVAAIDGATRAPVASLPAITIAFELQVAAALGYTPRLDACAGCGGPLSPRRLFSPQRGGLLCDRCAASEAGTVRLSADALAGLSLLLTRPVGEAGDYVEVRGAGEILRVVEAFLVQRFERFRGLRSLDVLRSLADAGSAVRPSAPPGAASEARPGASVDIRPRETPCPR